MTVEQKIEYAKSIALKHYEQGGDGMIECWDKQDFLDWFERYQLTTREQIHKECLQLFGLWHERAEGIRNTAF